MCVIDPLFSVISLQIELAKFLYLYVVVKLYMIGIFSLIIIMIYLRFYLEIDYIKNYDLFSMQNF